MTAERDPLDVILTMIDVRLSWLDPSSRQLLALLVRARGSVRSADGLARDLGLSNRHQLAYVLRTQGLPPLRTLAAWLRILVWLHEFETAGLTICRASLSEAKDPASRYRLVKRLTGFEWTTVRARGFVWLVEEFLIQCQPRGRVMVHRTVA